MSYVTLERTYEMTEVVGVDLADRPSLTHLLSREEWSTERMAVKTFCGMDRANREWVLSWEPGLRIEADEVCIRCRGHVDWA
jgi:hypothetical protein